MSKHLPGLGSMVSTFAIASLLAVAPALVARQARPQSDPPDRRQSPDETKPDSLKAKSRSKAKGGQSSKSAARRNLSGMYMGRPIAGVMSWEGVDWLFRETRIEEEQPEAMLDALK